MKCIPFFSFLPLSLRRWKRKKAKIYYTLMSLTVKKKRLEKGLAPTFERYKPPIKAE